MVALVVAIQIGREWAGFHSGLFRDLPAAEALLHPMTLAWFIGIAALSAAVVHQDPIPGVDQDWLIRPLHRAELLLAKLVFLALTISVPMFALNLASALAMGMPLGASLEAVLFKELFIFACFIVPVAAVASTTRNMTELVVIGAALILAFSSSVSLSAFFFGADWCPTCHTGMAWLQHLVQHVGILLGASVILFLDYTRRRYELSRALAVIGAVSLVFVQLPWSGAYAVEKWLSGSRSEAAAVTLELGADHPGPNATSPTSGASDVRQTTQLLLHGHVGQAFEDLHRRAHQTDAPVAIDFPVHIVGLDRDQLLLLDRSQALFFGKDGQLLYRSPNAGASEGLLTADGGEATSSELTHDQSIEIPGDVYRKAAAMAVRLEMDYTLTLVRESAVHELAALDGEFRSNDIGVCITRLDHHTVSLQCKTIAQAPFCYSATLYAADGRHNPEVFNCDPDYRRYWPALIDVLNFFGVELPVKERHDAHDTIDESELGNSYVLLKIYREIDHFKRSLDIANFQPERWRTAVIR
jgi:hypothetical protein